MSNYLGLNGTCVLLSLLANVSRTYVTHTDRYETTLLCNCVDLLRDSTVTLTTGWPTPQGVTSFVVFTTAIVSIVYLLLKCFLLSMNRHTCIWDMVKVHWNVFKNHHSFKLYLDYTYVDGYYGWLERLSFIVTENHKKLQEHFTGDKWQQRGIWGKSYLKLQRAIEIIFILFLS